MEDDIDALAARVREASRHINDGDTAKALAILEPLTSMEAVYLPARFLLSMTAWKMGRLDWALSLMRECHQRWPMDGNVAEILASLEAQTGNLSESLYMGKMATALGGLGGLIELVPNDFPTFDWAFLHIQDRPLLNRARVDAANGRIHEAIEAARQHTALNPSDGTARIYYASLLLAARQAGLAVDALRIIEDSDHYPAFGASLYARALTASGAFDKARVWHDRALALAPDDCEIASARILDGAWLDLAGEETRAKDWVERFCHAPKARRAHPIQARTVIAYLVGGIADSRDSAAVAAVVRAHDRDKVTVVGYGFGAQNWKTNAPFRGAFDSWRDINALDSTTLARFFLRDGVNVIVDAAGFAAPKSLLALAQTDSAVRISWFGNPPALKQPVFDLLMGDGAAEDSLPSGLYPLPQLNPVRRTASDVKNFGADVWFSQLDQETIGLWSALLRHRSDAKLLLRDNDMGSRGGVERLVALFGQDIAARIDIVQRSEAEEFYALVDAALLPRRGVSPREAAEAVACGIPVAAFGGNEPTEPYGSFLQALGLNAFVATDQSEYAAAASKLTDNGDRREGPARLIFAAREAGRDSARRLAQAFESCACDGSDRETRKAS